MFRILNFISFVSLFVCTLRVQATRMKYPDFIPDDDLARTEHYENDTHHPEFDHKAFLGEQEAMEWQKLPIDVVKDKLRELFPKIDIDKDNKVSKSELYDWMEQHMKKHVIRSADDTMKDLDTNEDGKASWEEYRSVKYHSSVEEGLDEETIKELREAESREEKKFEFADTDNDGQLSREELGLFLHPEESKRMTAYLSQENLDVFDKNKDGKISLEEYLLEDERKLDEANLRILTNNFNKDLDRNKDGFLDLEEVRHWILPGADDPIQSETNHLMEMADDDKDEFLSVEELVNHYENFAGSRMTKYGDLLQEKDEL